MSRILKKIVASKVTVHADRIDRPKRIRQTGSHHAYRTDVKGNVKIAINEQYPNDGSEQERPKTGSTISGDSATISSRRISKPKLDEKARQIVIVMKDNVQAIIYKRERKGRKG